MTLQKIIEILQAKVLVTPPSRRDDRAMGLCL
jgi:hypothetical protein